MDSAVCKPRLEWTPYISHVTLKKEKLSMDTESSLGKARPSTRAFETPFCFKWVNPHFPFQNAINIQKQSACHNYAYKQEKVN